MLLLYRDKILFSKECKRPLNRNALKDKERTAEDKDREIEALKRKIAELESWKKANLHHKALAVHHVKRIKGKKEKISIVIYRPH